MAVSDLQVETFSMWKWIHWDGSFMVFWKMFQPYDWDDIVPSWDWAWEDLYVLDETTSFNLSWFQQWHEVFAVALLISNQSSSTTTFDLHLYFDQYAWWWWQTRDVWWDYYWESIAWKTSSDTWANWYWFWAWIDPDEIRPWITQYRLRLVFDSTLVRTINFTVSNLNFDDTVCNAWYMWVEWANLCYVPPCYYSWSSTTGYKHRVQYDTGYSWATWQTPWMIWIPDDSTDHHIYYVTSNWVVRRTKESYPRVPTSSVGSSRRWHIRFTPSTSWSPEETWYNYLCYVDYGWYKRRLWTWDVD